MTKTKIVLAAVVALLVTLGAGYLWGAWGRWALDRQLRDAEERATVAEARGALLSARVDLTELNYGRAGGSIDRARKSLESLAGRYEQAGREQALTAVREAIARAGEAQQSAASVDQSAAAKIAESLKSLDRAASTK